MKIVVVSDSHGRNDILKTIQEKHPNAKLFIHCGDLEDDPMNFPGYIIVRGNNDYLVVLKMKESYRLVNIKFM